MASSTFTAVSGEGYELQMGRWSRRLAEPFLDFCGCGDGETVLDAGCGTGNLTFALARRAKDVRIEAVDLSLAYIEHATKLNKSPNITFRVGDICALPFADASFDRVLSLLVLHFVPDTKQAVSELRRVARPGATVAAAAWDARGGLVAHRILLDTAAMLGQNGIEFRARSFTRPTTRPGELAAAWRSAGFVDVRDTMLAVRMEFASFDDYWTPYLGKEGPAAQYVSSLSPVELDRLRDGVREAYLDGDPDGPRSYAAVAWAVAGTAPA